MRIYPIPKEPSNLGELAKYRGWLNSEAVAQVETLDCVADSSGSLDGTYFVLTSSAGTTYGVWIDIDNGGGSAPAGAAACDVQIECTTAATDDADSAVATAVASAVDGHAAFTASADGATVTVTHVAPGIAAVGVDGDTGFTFDAATTEGTNAGGLLFTGPGIVRKLEVRNLHSSAVELMIFDAAAVPEVGTAATYDPVYLAASGAGANYARTDKLYVQDGLVVISSAAAATLTGGDGHLAIYCEFDPT